MRANKLSILSSVALLAAAACRPKQPPAPPAAPPPPPAPEAPADPADAIITKIGAVLGCMNMDLRAKRDAGDPELVAYGRTSFTDAFVFDWMVADPKRLEGDKGDNDRLCTAIKAEYRRLAAPVLAQRRKNTGKVGLAPLPVEVEAAFVHQTKGVIATHLLEHAELTAEALPEIFPGPKRPIFDLIARAAAVADEYRWNDTRYHALAEPSEPGWRERDVPGNQDSFAALAVQHLWHFKQAMDRKTWEIAAGELGAVCHLAADLALHHGMTRRQLAALTFFAGKPPTLTAPAVRADAKRSIKEMIKIARALSADEAGWRKLLAWAAPAGLDPERGFAWVFAPDREAGRLNYVDLARFYAMQLPFHRTPALREEIGDGPNGLPQWQAPALLEAIRTKLSNGGFTPRRPKLASDGAR
jgi:hypothetical protein